ncbi:MAG: LTA synthase family protein [Mediterranea sp.]|jgi:phosphoglycerol transferase MdoB-like AlkP superfamily enzyme|nr:LTA synthase family protein [Mediterranea sp.]
MKRFLHLLAYLFIVHLSALLVTTLFRLALFASSHHQLSAEALSRPSLSGLALLHGVWFDNVIGCYILLPALVAVVACALCDYSGKALFRSCTVYFSVLYGCVFAISAADIPYFGYFFRHLNSGIFEWFGYAGTTVGMITGERSYWLYIGLFLLVLAGFVYWVRQVGKRFRLLTARIAAAPTLLERGGQALAGACLIGLCLFGIRGRTGYNPIKVSAAYFCHDAFLNQLGVSPTFNLLTSVLDDLRPENKQLHLMDEQEALRNAQAYLHRSGEASVSPLAIHRAAHRDTTGIAARRPNVVLIMMESMSASFMQRFGQRQRLTPFLDSLYTRSLSFSRFYSAGIHTNHGLYATHYSFPAMMKRNLMKGTVIPHYSGLPTVLKQHGYHTLFFMTHEGQYDNMNAFFRTNGFDEVYSQEDYPREKVVNSFGVQDDFLYQYALPVLNRQAASGQPFFATLLSISNHPPYVIPPYFHPTTSQPETQIVEYADWAVRQFFAEARKQPWFANTIFVLEGDHGKLVGDAECELPQSYNHIPLMIYAPEIIAPEEKECFAGQIDIQPTLLGLLDLDYTQNNFGIDLLREQRPCIFYTADNLIAARDATKLFLYNPETGQEFCYRIAPDGKLTHTTPDKSFLPLKTYSFSMLQSAEYLVKHGETTASAT